MGQGAEYREKDKRDNKRAYDSKMRPESRLYKMSSAAAHDCDDKQKQHNLERSELSDADLGVPRLANCRHDLKNCASSRSDEGKGEPCASGKRLKQGSGCSDDHANGSAHKDPPKCNDGRCEFEQLVQLSRLTNE